MEHIVHSHLMNFLESNNRLVTFIWLSEKEVAWDSATTYSEWSGSWIRHSSKKIDAILVDFSKAFGTVPHQRLASKLHHYGIRDQSFSWIKSFLTERSQQVVLDGKSSSPAPATFGVPQGTVFGLYQRPALNCKSHLISTPICRWLSTV